MAQSSGHEVHEIRRGAGREGGPRRGTTVPPGAARAAGLMPVDNPATGQVILGQDHVHLVARQDLDFVLVELAGEIGQDLDAAVQAHLVGSSPTPQGHDTLDGGFVLQAAKSPSAAVKK